MNCVIVSKDNSINEAVSQGLAELRSAGSGVRRSWSSYSKILTRVWGEKFHVKIACWNVRTLLQKGQVENVKHELARLGINVLGLSESKHWTEREL